MYLRATAAWLLLAVLMVINGTARELLYAGALGDAAAHVASSITGIGIVFGFAGWFVRRSPAGAVAPWWRIGGFWAALTIAFELLFGHYVDGASWTALLAEYDLLRGRLWPLVLGSTLVAPPLWGAYSTRRP